MILRASLAAGWLLLPMVAVDAHAQAAAAGCGPCGVVQSIAPVSDRQEWTSLGTVAPSTTTAGGFSGSGAGGTTAFAIGPGFTNQGMVVLGAAGGAAYAQKPNEYRRQRWEVTVKMDNGPPRVVSLSYEPLFVQEGDRVRIAGNNIELVTP